MRTFCPPVSTTSLDVATESSIVSPESALDVTSSTGYIHTACVLEAETDPENVTNPFAPEKLPVNPYWASVPLYTSPSQS